MLNNIISALLNKFSLFHHVDTPVEPTAAPKETPRQLHSINKRSTTPRTVNFVVSGSVNGQTADLITGGENDTKESVRDLLVSLFRSQRGITNVVITDPLDKKRYDAHTRGNTVVILAEDNSYNETVEL